MVGLFKEFTYLGIFVALLLRGLGFPIPEDVPLLIAGFLCAKGTCSVGLILAVSITGVFIADIICFSLGKHFGKQVHKIPILRRVITEKRLAKASRQYHLHGKKALVITRFLPGGKTPLFFMAGTLAIPFKKFFLIDFPCVVLNVLLLIAIGWFFGDHLDLIIDVFEKSKWFTLTALAAAAIILVSVAVIKKRNIREN